jgi:RNA polymerase sigma-70 factor (ECF subfamily)
MGFNKKVKSDEDLILEYLQYKSKDASKELIDRYYNTAFKTAAGYIKSNRSDISDAKDIVQSAFEKVFHHLNTFDPKQGVFAAWFSTIVLNLCRDWSRQKKKHVNEKPYDPTDSRDEELVHIKDSQIVQADDKLITSETYNYIMACSQNLSEKHAEIFRLREIDDLSYEAIADLLKIKVGTVMSRLFHMRHNMMNCLMQTFDQQELVDLRNRFQALYLKNTSKKPPTENDPTDKK